jgi:hypothetical protein
MKAPSLVKLYRPFRGIHMLPQSSWYINNTTHKSGNKVSIKLQQSQHSFLTSVISSSALQLKNLDEKLTRRVETEEEHSPPHQQ